MFGGWDNRVKHSDDHSLQVIYTTGFNSWELFLNDSFRLNGREMLLPNFAHFNNTAIIDANYPFIYIPQEHWNEFFEDDLNEIFMAELKRVLPK